MVHPEEEIDARKFRSHVLTELSALNLNQAKLEDSQADILKSIKRIEAQTRLARNMQDVSKATQLIWDGLACVFRTFIRVLSVGTVLYLLIYAAFHEGHFPAWSHEWLKVIRKD